MARSIIWADPFLQIGRINAINDSVSTTKEKLELLCRMDHAAGRDLQLLEPGHANHVCLTFSLRTSAYALHIHLQRAASLVHNRLSCHATPHARHVSCRDYEIWIFQALAWNSWSIARRICGALGCYITYTWNEVVDSEYSLTSTRGLVCGVSLLGLCIDSQ